MAFSLMVRAHFRVTQRLKPKQSIEYELSMLPSEPHSAPSPFPAAHPSRAVSPTSQLTISTYSTSVRSAASDNSASTHSTVTHSNCSLDSNDLIVNNVILPLTPVLRPRIHPMLGLTTTIPELQLDPTVPIAMSLPETPVLRPVSYKEAELEIPDLSLDSE